MLVQAWRVFAPVIQGHPAARSELPTLTASEVGTFVFCPEAWYLQRRHARQSATAEKRLEIGIQAHRQIGHETDRLLKVQSVRLVLWVTVLLLALLLVAQFMGMMGIPHP
jgi:hypothetical protein